MFYQVEGQCNYLLGYFELWSDKLNGDADFLFLQDYALAHSAKTTTNWFADLYITVFD